MMKAHFGVLAVVGSLAAFAAAAPAQALPISITNTTWVESYNGANPYAWFPSNSYWGQNIGAPTYETSGLTISMPDATTMVFEFATNFDGDDTTYDNPSYGNVVVRYADIFLNVPGGTQYAIVLGDETDNGGVAAPGVYEVTSAKTSQDIWDGRTQFVYGGQYAPDGASNQPDTADATPSPTVVTAGTVYTAAGAGSAPLTVASSYTTGELAVTLTAADPADFGFLLGAYDLFWGTGDCSNAPLDAEVSSPLFGDRVPVPEPTSLSLIAMALAGLGVLRARRVGGKRVRMAG
jgi:hypothetical protein